MSADEAFFYAVPFTLAGSQYYEFSSCSDVSETTDASQKHFALLCKEA